MKDKSVQKEMIEFVIQKKPFIQIEISLFDNKLIKETEFLASCITDIVAKYIESVLYEKDEMH